MHRGHTSIMPEILQKKTSLKVIPATDQSKVQPGHVYVNGPDQDVAINDRTLQLMDINKDDTPHLPVDFFLRTLAADCGENAACLILSGTGTDGTLGAREIKAGDGMVMVQEPGTAKYNGMPNSAIQTGVADFVLAPEKMPAVLLDYFSTAFRLKRQSDIEAGARHRKRAWQGLSAVATADRTRLQPLQKKHPYPPPGPAHEHPANRGPRPLCGLFA